MASLLRVVLAAFFICMWLAPARGNAQQPSTPLVDLCGDPLPPLAVQRLGTDRFGAEGIGPIMVPSPDCKSLATAAGHSVNVWDLKTGRHLQRFDGHPFSDVLFFSPDGQSIFTHIQQFGLRQWDIQSGKKLRDIETGKLWLKSACLTPDGKNVALSLGELVGKSDRGVGLYRHWIELRDISTSTLVRKFALLEQPLARTSLAIAPDGKLLQGLETKNENVSELVRWDPATGKEHSRLALNEPIHNSYFTPDQKYLAFFTTAAKTWKSLQVWDLEAGKPLAITPPKTFATKISLFAMAPNGKHALAIIPPSTITPLGHQGITAASCICWNLEDGKVFSKIEVHHSALPRSFTPDGKMLLGNTPNGLIQRWDAATGQIFPGPVGHQTSVWQLTWAPDGKRIASSSSDAVLLWDAKTGQELLNVAKVSGFGVLFMDKGKRLAILNANRSQVIDALSSDLRTIPAVPMFHDRGVMNYAVSPDGNFLAVTTNAGTVGRPGVISDPRLHVWDVAGKRQLGNWKIPHYPAETFGPRPVAFVPKTVQLVFAKATSTEKNPGSTLVLWDFVRGHVTKEIGSFGQCPSEVFFTPDGKTLITREITGMMRLWDVGSGKERLGIQPYEKSTNWRMDLSPDGKMIATCSSSESRICFWELATGKKIGQLSTTQKGIGCVAFSPNGKFIASGTANTTIWVSDTTITDTTILIWDLAKVLESIREK